MPKPSLLCSSSAPSELYPTPVHLLALAANVPMPKEDFCRRTTIERKCLFLSRRLAFHFRGLRVRCAALRCPAGAQSPAPGSMGDSLTKDPSRRSQAGRHSKANRCCDPTGSTPATPS